MSAELLGLSIQLLPNHTRDLGYTLWVVLRSGSEPAESRFRNLIITYPVAIPTIPNKIARLVESSGKGGEGNMCTEEQNNLFCLGAEW